MDTKTNIEKQENKIPALAINLKGRNLIEASAGTGKTWTLTGILLRLLLEANFQPRQLCATTFTRKAASEMRERIEKKMQSLLNLAKFLAQEKAQDEDFWQDDENFSKRLENQLAFWAKNSEKLIAEAAGDEIIKHLFLNAAEQGLTIFTDFLRNCENAEKSLSDMFIGTFDSLCQKWLLEFALETGTTSSEKLLEDEIYPIANLVNNGLRKYYYSIENKKYDLGMLINSELTADNYSWAIKNNLSFFKSEFSNLNKYSEEQLLTYLKQVEEYIELLDFSQLKNFPEHNFEKYIEGINANTHKALKTLLLKDNFNRLLNNLIKKDISYLEEKEKENLYSFFTDCEGVFKKNYIKLSYELNELEDFYFLQDCFLILYKYENIKKELNKIISSNIAKENWNLVKNQLPNYLEKRGETIFSEQIAKLNRALENNKNLAQFIARHYPVMLVDESQDLNAEQTELLKKIYIDYLPENGFFMPVGDPKQAIYLFRGGDVYNYNYLKDFFPKENRFSLNKSYRTTENLIQNFNLFYQDIDEEKPYFGNNIEYQIMSAANNEPEIFNQGEKIKTPIISFNAQTKEEELSFVAQLVANLLSKKSQFHRKIDNQAVPLKSSDILILSRTNESLAEIKNKLEEKNIEVEISLKDNYLFENEIPRVLETLFAAFLEPHNSEFTNSLMISVLFNSDLENQKLKDEITKALIEAGRIWQQRALSAAFNYFCTEMKIWQRVASYKENNQRFLLDLRQISQILPNFERQLLPQEVLEKWREFLINPALAGYKADEIENQNCVRLMTLHGSKGLESPIVIVLGLNEGNQTNKNEIFKTYFDEESKKRIIFTGNEEEEEIKAIEQGQEENSRLLYVALTRARELLFIVRKTRKGLKALEKLGIDKKSLVIENADKIINKDDYLVNLNSDEVIQERENFQEDEKETNFLGWRKSSFTALVSNAQEANLAIESKDFELENSEELKPELEEESLNLRQFTFAKGTAAGSFLHKVLETWQQEGQIRWDKKEDLEEKFLEKRRYINILRRRFGLAINSQVEDEENAQLVEWVEKINQSPLISTAKLEEISPKQKACEMSFTLLANSKKFFANQKVNDLFKKWGKNFALDKISTPIAFLRGEIDLCYQWKDKFYIVDYKSNYLGNRAEDYRPEKLALAMDEHGYWLQALIYQTALHRHLKNRLKNYQINKHLAAVEYFFLRAVGVAEGDGHLKIEIPAEIVLEFDEIISK